MACNITTVTPMALTWIRTHDWDAEHWRNTALCRDTSPDMFFPIGTTGVALDQIAAAKTICDGCPVKDQCLEFALMT
jgi:WhiB family redox-sensing transcriptional regulator